MSTETTPTTASLNAPLHAPLPVTLHANLNGIAKLSHLGVIRVAGADAAPFLQGQLTQDFLTLGAHEARLAAFCSAKGRMQASFISFKKSSAEADDILLVCNRDILPATVKRLSMFVLRAKVKLSDASGEFGLFGLAQNAIYSVAGYACPVGVTGQFGIYFVVGLREVDGSPRALCLAPAGDPSPVGELMDEAVWLWGEVRSGIASINAQTVDKFVPQMLNYESVGGVNFKKGCYPGQEVVARSQFRGTLKRRAYLVHCDAPMAAGDEVFVATDADQAVGTVAQAAPSPQGGFDAVVSMQVAAALAGGLRLGSATGAALELLPLPYPLLEDI